MQRRDIYIAGQ